MGFSTPKLTELEEQHWQDFKSRLNPVKSSIKFDILKINSQVNAGMFHLLHENLRFLALQLFPDTAEGEFLDAHWSWRSSNRKLETFAVGTTEVSGVPGTKIIPGNSWDIGEITYSAQEAVTIGESGKALIKVRALIAGKDGDAPEGETLNTADPIPGLKDQAKSKGIDGGTDRENDPDYQNRMLTNLRVGTKYGKPGDWASWARDSTSEVAKAWEYPLSDSYGTLLIQVMGQNDENVSNLGAVKTFIDRVAPPMLWTVETPTRKPFNYRLHMLKPSEDNAQNRKAAEDALREWMDENGRPKLELSAGLLSIVASAPAGITYAEVSFPGSVPTFTNREFPILGTVSWI